MHDRWAFCALTRSVILQMPNGPEALFPLLQPSTASLLRDISRFSIDIPGGVRRRNQSCSCLRLFERPLSTPDCFTAHPHDLLYHFCPLIVTAYAMQPIPQYNTPASSGWPAESYPVLPNAGGQYQDGMHLASFNPYPSYDNGALDQQQNIGNDGTQPSAFPYTPSVPGSFSEACQGPMPSHDEHQPSDENTWNFPQLNGLAGYPLDNASLVGAPRDYHGTGPSTSLIADASAFPIDFQPPALPATHQTAYPTEVPGSFNPFDSDQVHAQGIEGSLHLGASSFAQLPAADTSNTATIGPNEAYSLTYLLGDTGTTLDDNSIWPASNIQLTGASISSHHIPSTTASSSRIQTSAPVPYYHMAAPRADRHMQSPYSLSPPRTPMAGMPNMSHARRLAVPGPTPHILSASAPHTPFLSGLPLASTSASFPAGDLGNYPFANQYPQANPLQQSTTGALANAPPPSAADTWFSPPLEPVIGPRRTRAGFAKALLRSQKASSSRKSKMNAAMAAQTAIAAEAVEGQVQQPVEMVHCTMHMGRGKAICNQTVEVPKLPNHIREHLLAHVGPVAILHDANPERLHCSKNLIKRADLGLTCFWPDCKHEFTTVHLNDYTRHVADVHFTLQKSCKACGHYFTRSTLAHHRRQGVCSALQLRNQEAGRPRDEADV
ncbi:unnamed protein product [Mycena citricolor]|uniref:Uncharacterized protein n=1 Tax=Mycena citricolor TaxID=2018698 RepID=A0AAD2K3F1_9AGAR|nr:unnamed protein product [Mycena citricolor]